DSACGRCGKPRSVRFSKERWARSVRPRLRQRPCASAFYVVGGVNRSPYKIANWFIAVRQDGAARAHFAVIFRKASQISFVAASSFGKWPRVLRILRSRACTLSSAFVV